MLSKGNGETDGSNRENGKEKQIKIIVSASLNLRTKQNGSRVILEYCRIWNQNCST